MNEEVLVSQGKSTEDAWFTPTTQASNVYEGTDSEDDEIIMSKGRIHVQNNVGAITFENGRCTRKSFLVHIGLVC